MLRHGVAALLGSQPGMALVGEGSTAREALTLVREHESDVILLDAQLPDHPGAETCRALRRERSGLGVILFSALDDDRARFDAILAGAAGYLLKSTPASHLVAALRQVGGGESLFDPDAAAGLLTRLGQQISQKDARLQRLKPAELRILQLISRGHTNRQIATRVSLSERTVKKYVSNILATLDVASRAGAAAYLAERSASEPSFGGLQAPIPPEAARTLPKMQDTDSSAIAELTATLEEQQALLEECRLQTAQLLDERDGLKVDRERYRDLYQLAPLPYLVTDPVGLITRANRQAAELLGYSEDLLECRPLAAFISNGARREFRRRLEAIDGATGRAEWTLLVHPEHRAPFTVAATITARRDFTGIVELRWMFSRSTPDPASPQPPMERAFP